MSAVTLLEKVYGPFLWALYKLGTDALGLIPKLGKLLSTAKLGLFLS